VALARRSPLSVSKACQCEKVPALAQLKKWSLRVGGPPMYKLAACSTSSLWFSATFVPVAGSPVSSPIIRASTARFEVQVTLLRRWQKLPRLCASHGPILRPSSYKRQQRCSNSSFIAQPGPFLMMTRIHACSNPHTRILTAHICSSCYSSRLHSTSDVCHPVVATSPSFQYRPNFEGACSMHCHPDDFFFT
jgi:hypothetical protein